MKFNFIKKNIKGICIYAIVSLIPSVFPILYSYKIANNKKNDFKLNIMHII